MLLTFSIEKLEQSHSNRKLGDVTTTVRAQSRPGNRKRAHPKDKAVQESTPSKRLPTGRRGGLTNLIDPFQLLHAARGP